MHLITSFGWLLQVFDALTSSEQLEVMSRLGYYHVWNSVSRPEGLHFRLDLTQLEQRDVAKEVVKVRHIATLCV